MEFKDMLNDAQKMSQEKNKFIYHNKNNWIDLSNLPKKQWRGNTVVNWEAVNDHSVQCFYEGALKSITLSFDFKRNGVSYVKIVSDIATSTVQAPTLKKVPLIKHFLSNNYVLDVGDVHKNCIVLEKIKGHGGRRAYKLKCLLSGIVFEKLETPFLNSLKDSPYKNYLSSQEKWLEDHLVNKEDMRKFSKYSSRYIELVCPNCKNRHKKQVCVLVKSHSVFCSFCSSGVSFPEKIMMAVLKLNNLDFIHQKEVVIDGRKYYFDFYLPDYNLVIETHGLQHYENIAFFNTKKIIKSDNKKKFYCSVSNIEYVAIDCSKSDLKFILSNINIPLLKNKDINAVRNVFTREHSNTVVRDYTKGLSLQEIAERHGLHKKTVKRRLRKLGIDTSEKREKYKKVVLLNKKIVFKSQKQACNFAKISTGYLASHLNEKQAVAGRDPLTNEHFVWMRLEDYALEHGTKDLIYYEEGE